MKQHKQLMGGGVQIPGHVSHGGEAAEKQARLHNRRESDSGGKIGVGAKSIRRTMVNMMLRAAVRIAYESWLLGP